MAFAPYADRRNEVVTLAVTTEQFFARVLERLQGPELTAWSLVRGFLSSRMLEFHRAAITLCKLDQPTPVAIIILARAQYESWLDLACFVKELDETKREASCKYYLKFGEYKHIDGIADKLDPLQYQKGLKPEKQEHWVHRVQIHDEVKANFTPEQQNQKKRVTWDGKFIRGRVCLAKLKEHDQWYGLMCLVSHPNAAMHHKSITLQLGKPLLLAQPDYGVEDAIGWLLRMTRILLCAGAQLSTHMQDRPFSKEPEKLLELIRQLEDACSNSPT